MNAGDIQRALIRYINWWENIIVPEFSLENGNGPERADVIQVTRSGYATEYEIKISAADWRADLQKPKWKTWPANTGFVTRFFYVVPGKVVDDKRVPAIKPPDNLPFGVGVILVMMRGGCTEAVAARRFKAPPVPAATMQRIKDAFYYRYWRYVTTVDVAQVRRELLEARRTCPRCGSRMKCQACENARRSSSVAVAA